MAANATSRSVIDNLPEVQRRKVLNAIIEGKSLRAVASIVGCSHTVVQDYKRKVVMPAMKKAQQLQSFQPLPESNAVALQQQASLTRDIVQTSPFRDRLENLWERTTKALDRAEETKELAPMAPLLNQAHKNVELLGRVTGELEVQAAANVAIQIVMPSIAPASAEAGCGGSTAGSAVIDIAMPKR